MGPLGEKQRFIRVISGMSKYHEEPWYVETVAAGRPIWSSVYQWEDDESVFAISFNQPVFSASGKLLGVIGVDFILSQLRAPRKKRFFLALAVHKKMPFGKW